MPTAQLKVRGSWLVNKRKGEPEPATGVPDMPEWVPAKAKTIYTGLCERIARAGTLTSADGDAVGLLAVALASLRVAQSELEREGLTIDGSMGQKAGHPTRQQWVWAWDRAMKACKEFGLSPAARVGLTTTNDGKKLDSCFAM